MRTGRPASVRTLGRAPWGLRLPPVAGAGFHVVLSGTCWLVPLENAPHLAPVALTEGDVVFLRDGRGHILADDPATPAVEEQPEQFSAGPVLGTLTIGGDGPQTSLLCGNYHLDQGRPHPLVGQLPEIIHLPTGNGRHAELSAAVQLLKVELDSPRIGSAGIVPALIEVFEPEGILLRNDAPVRRKENLPLSPLEVHGSVPRARGAAESDVLLEITPVAKSEDVHDVVERIQLPGGAMAGS